MLDRLRLAPKTIRGQITVIIILVLITVLTTGRVLEKWVKHDYTAPDIENMSEQISLLAEVMQAGSPLEREVMLTNARRAGWDLSLQPVAIAKRFQSEAPPQSSLSIVANLLFPPDRPAPVGGWRTFLSGERVIAARIDDATLLVLSGVPDTILTDSLVGEGSYYFVAFFVLMVFFFIFAIRVITEPIKRIADAATASDIKDDERIFLERGSVEIVALARALNGMRSRISLMVEARTRMLRGIGHDLRTPLTRLRLRADRLEEGPLRDALLSDVDRIDTLLKESLNYLRDDYASEPVERVDVASILQTVCSDFADVGFDVAYDGPDKLIANCRPLSITRAVTNLCDNAVKFAGKATVRLTAERDGLTLSVIDDGPGIPEALRSRVFEPFFKGDIARTGEKSGFGLGLSIVADIARSHRAEVKLTTRAPQGLVVAMTIPNVTPPVEG